MTTHNAALNQLLIDLGRSLLQYVGESWPWTSTTSSAKGQFDALVRREQQSVARLAALLNRRRWTIDFGSYPTEYTDLHYCSLDYLIGQLIQSASENLASVTSLRDRVSDDAEAAALLNEVAIDQEKIVNELRAIRNSLNAKSPA